MSPEPPVYRPFALLALAATLAGGIPLGVWLLAWLYLGAAAVPAAWILLLSPSPFMLWLLGLQGAATALRIGGTAGSWSVPVLVASLLQAGGEEQEGPWVWRMLDPPPLVFLRWHLTTSSLWLAGAAGSRPGCASTRSAPISPCRRARGSGSLT